MLSVNEVIHHLNDHFKTNLTLSSKGVNPSTDLLVSFRVKSREIFFRNQRQKLNYGSKIGHDHLTIIIKRQTASEYVCMCVKK